MTAEEQKKVLDELGRHPEGASQGELKRTLGWHGTKLGQVLVALRMGGFAVRRGELWIKTNDPAPQTPPQNKEPLSLDEIVAELSTQDSSQIKIELDDANQKILSEIYSTYVNSKIRYCPKNYLTQIPDLDKVLTSLTDKELILIENTSAFMTVKGMQTCDPKWTFTRIAYAVLTAINEGEKAEDGQKKDDYIPIEVICRSSGLYNWKMFSDMLENFISNDIVAYEERGRINSRFFTLTAQGQKLLERLCAILDAPKPEMPQLPKPQEPAAPPKPAEPAPIVEVPKVEPTPPAVPTEAVLTWGNPKIERILIGNNIYQIVVVGEKGRLENRITEAKYMGYIGLTIFERKYLPQMAKYVNSEGFDLNSAIENIDLPRGRILALLENYKAKGIAFPEAKAPPAKPESYNNCSEVLQKYKDGQQQSEKALESIVEIVTRWETEVADLRKRIEKLEKK
jgi:predicted transcriptional regulator